MAILKTGAKIAATAYLCHNIVLAYCCLKSVIGSSFSNDSTLRCSLISLSGLYNASPANKFISCLYFKGALSCWFNHSFVYSHCIVIGFYLYCLKNSYASLLKYVLITFLSSYIFGIYFFLIFYAAYSLVVILFYSSNNLLVNTGLDLKGYCVYVVLL